LNCDGINKGGGWTCNPGGYYAQIASAANMASGGGGSGYRNWYGDGKNQNSGSIVINFATPQTELWVRCRAVHFSSKVV